MIFEFSCHQYGSQECLFFRESEKWSFRRLLVMGYWLLSWVILRVVQWGEGSCSGSVLGRLNPKSQSPCYKYKGVKECCACVCHHYLKILDCGLILYGITYCTDRVRFFPFFSCITCTYILHISYFSCYFIAESMIFFSLKFYISFALIYLPPILAFFLFSDFCCFSWLLRPLTFPLLFSSLSAN